MCTCVCVCVCVYECANNIELVQYLVQKFKFFFVPRGKKKTFYFPGYS